MGAVFLLEPDEVFFQVALPEKVHAWMAFARSQSHADATG